MASIRYIQSRKGKRPWQVRWFVKIQHGTAADDHKSGSLTFKTKDEATAFKKYIDRQEDAWRAGRNVNQSTIIDAKKAWEVHLLQNTDQVQDLYKREVTKFIDALPKTATGIIHIQTTHIRRFLADYLATGVKHRTANNTRDAIRSFCGYIADHYDIPNPAAGVKKFKTDPPDPRILTDEEYQAAIDHADDHLDEMLFIANTGLRATEYCSVVWSNISKDMQTLTVLGKGRKRRSIPLNKTCIEILKKKTQHSHKSNTHIFILKSNEKMNRYKLSNHFRTISNRAKIKRFGPHALRHYFGSRLVRSGVDIYKVSKIMGHSSVTITEKIYIHILPKDLRGLTDVIG